MGGAHIMIVYRIEDGSGRGLYHTENHKIDAIVDTHFWGPSNHPLPSEDGFSRSVLSRLKTQYGYWLFGFVTVNQLFDWFDAADPCVLDHLFKEQAIALKLDIPSRYVICKEHQCVFRQTHATQLDIFKTREALANEPF